MKVLIAVTLSVAIGVSGLVAYRHFTADDSEPTGQQVPQRDTASAVGRALPAVGQVLSAEHTLLVGGLGHLDELAATGVELLKTTPVVVLGPLAPAIDQTQRMARLGFDPASAEGWASVGLDADAGFAVALTQPQGGSQSMPVLLLKVVDRSRLLSAVETWAGNKPMLGSSDGVDTLTVGADTTLFGTRGEWTAILLDRGRHDMKAREAFAAFLSYDGPVLADAIEWKHALAGGRGAVEAFGFVKLAGLARQLDVLDVLPGVADALRYYTGLFGSLGMSVTRQGGVFQRLTVTDHGREALRRVFRPKAAPPTFSEYVPPRGWAAIRISANLEEVFEGVGPLLPPGGAAQLKAQLGSAKTMVSSELGIDWADVAAAFSGHIVLASRLPQMGHRLDDAATPDFVLLLGVGDGLARHWWVASLLRRAVQMTPNGRLEEANVGDAHGWVVGVGPWDVTVVRDENVWLVGSGAAVEAALAAKSGANLKGKADVLDDPEVALGLWSDAGRLIQLMSADLRGAPVLRSAPLRPLIEDPFLSVGWRVDELGWSMRWGGPLDGATVVMGWAATIVVPAVFAYTRRRKTAEAVVNLRLIAQAAMAYYEQERTGSEGHPTARTFPPAAPLTPTYDRCARGTDRFPPDAAQWNLPGWVGLGFSIEEPHYYRYSFVSSGSGLDAAFTARAIGDLDCDGIHSTFERVGWIDAAGKPQIRLLADSVRDLE